jgi:DNA-binding CsgD family transcriptional regulator
VQQETESYKIMAAIAELNESIDPESLHDRLHRLFANVLNSELVAFGEILVDESPYTSDVSETEGKQSESVGYKILYEGSDLSLSSGEFSIEPGVDAYIQPSRSGGGTISYQIGISVNISESSKIDLTLRRASRAFTETDKTTFIHLIPHLRNAIRSSNEVRHLMDRSDHYENLLSRVSRGYIRVTTEGDALEITARAFTTLKRHFAEWNPRTEQLPADVSGWLRSTISNDENAAVVSPLRITGATGELRFSPVYDHSSRSITLLIEERARISPSHLTIAGLTTREIEILQMMEAGKPDSVIAILLDISHRTVQKHVENIFRKLNAETRTEAVHKATDIVRFVSSDSFGLADLRQKDPEK